MPAPAKAEARVTKTRAYVFSIRPDRRKDRRDHSRAGGTMDRIAMARFLSLLVVPIAWFDLTGCESTSEPEVRGRVSFDAVSTLPHSP